MFLKVYFLNFRYFFIVKKQQLVLYSYITYREIENNQPGSGAFARFPHPHPGEFTKEMLMPGGQPGGGWALLELTDALILAKARIFSSSTNIDCPNSIWPKSEALRATVKKGQSFSQGHYPLIY